jgi:NAD-dependent DNA ligase
MNNEIKKIDALLFYLIHTDRLKQEEKQYIVDYITILQQLEQEHKKINGELREENNKLEIALQNIQEDYDRRIKEIDVLKKELNNKEFVFVGTAQNKTRDFIKNLVKEKNDYKSRCEKAIEYMKKNGFIDINDYWKIVKFYKDLLNILQNGSEEE